MLEGVGERMGGNDTTHLLPLSAQRRRLALLFAGNLIFIIIKKTAPMIFDGRLRREGASAWGRQGRLHRDVYTVAPSPSHTLMRASILLWFPESFASKRAYLMSMVSAS